MPDPTGTVLALVRERIAEGKEQHSDQRKAAAALGRWIDFEKLARDALDPLVEALEAGMAAWRHWSECLDCGRRPFGERWCPVGATLHQDAEYAQRTALADLQEQLVKARDG